MLRYRVAMEVRKFLDAQRLHRHRDADAHQVARPKARATTWCRRACTTGMFFALPQSPQLFKQLLMVAGFDRYYQIVKCFRDEDLRADRQPEFTQIDIETSFLDEDEIRDDVRGAWCARVQGSARRRAAGPVPGDDATPRRCARYGSDKPDLRVQLELTELTDVDEGRRLQGVLAAPANAAGRPRRGAARAAAAAR